MLAKHNEAGEAVTGRKLCASYDPGVGRSDSHLLRFFSFVPSFSTREEKNENERGSILPTFWSLLRQIFSGVKINKKRTMKCKSNIKRVVQLLAPAQRKIIS